MTDAVTDLIDRLAAGAVSPAALILGALILCAAALLVRNALIARRAPVAEAESRAAETGVLVLDNPLPRETEAQEPLRRAA